MRDLTPYLAALTIAALFTVGIIFASDQPQALIVTDATVDPTVPLPTVDSAPEQVPLNTTPGAPGPVASVTPSPGQAPGNAQEVRRAQTARAMTPADLDSPNADRLNNARQVGTTMPPPPKPAPDTARCPEWWPTARNAGWPEHNLQHLDRIIYGESRCDPRAFNGRGGDQSYGLVQINVRSSTGNRSIVGPLVDWDWTRLYDPTTNLTVALVMAEYWEDHSWAGNCRWWGWTTRDRNECG